MKEITGDMKLADVVRRWPETAKVFRSRGCQDVDADLMARIMTVRNAARMEGIDLDPLLEDLNRANSRKSSTLVAREFFPVGLPYSVSDAEPSQAALKFS